MKQTLLDLTQNILSAMSSDEVNSISDSAESMQVAQIVKNKFYDIIAREDLPDQDQLFQLDPSNDVDAPTLMYLPAGCSKLTWIKYYNSNVNDTTDTTDHDINTDIIPTASTDPSAPPGYTYVTVLPIQQFMDMMLGFNPMNTDVETFTFTEAGRSYTFYYKNDKQPQYCTILSNRYVIFDGYDATQDSTLQASKTMCMGQTVPIFEMTDTFIPPLDDQQFPLLLNEAKALAYYEIKQQPHQMANVELKRQWATVQKNKSISNKPTYFEQLPNYGRAGRGWW